MTARYIVTYVQHGETVRELTPFDSYVDAVGRVALVILLRGYQPGSAKIEEIESKEPKSCST